MQIRDLALSDAEQLLDFESRNRDWFERFIMPRPDQFFTRVAVQDHIRAYLLARQQGRFHGCVVTDESGHLIARANLREINLKRGTAEIGYRVDEAHAGQGVASFATGHLIRLAYADWGLTQLRGFVGVDNAASARVLEKNGFVKIGLHANLARLRRGNFDCFEYQHLPEFLQMPTHTG